MLARATGVSAEWSVV